jgi:hypothetical protein
MDPVVRSGGERASTTFYESPFYLSPYFYGHYVCQKSYNYPYRIGTSTLRCVISLRLTVPFRLEGIRIPFNSVIVPNLSFAIVKSQ